MVPGAAFPGITVPAPAFRQATLPLGAEPPAEQLSHRTHLVRGLRLPRLAAAVQSHPGQHTLQSDALAEYEAGARSHS